MSRKRKGLRTVEASAGRAGVDYAVVIGVPSTQYWSADFGMSISMLMAYVSERRIAPDARSQRVYLNNVKGSILPKLRQDIANNALQRGATHVLFIDSDMTFPKDTLTKLLSRKQRVIAANCVAKAMPARTTARLADGTEGGVPVLSAGRQGIERVWRVGTGVMLVETSVFREIPPPHFIIGWNDKEQAYVGEDWSFCAKLEEAGIPIFVDHGISNKIEHVGEFRYNHVCVVSEEEAEAVREALAR